LPIAIIDAIVPFWLTAAMP